jgi:hypothetical protein
LLVVEEVLEELEQELLEVVDSVVAVALLYKVVLLVLVEVDIVINPPEQLVLE